MQQAYFELPPQTSEFTADWLQNFYASLERMLRPLMSGELPVLESLPTASADYYSQYVIHSPGGGVADSVHVCLKDAAGSYVWGQVTVT